MNRSRRILVVYYSRTGTTRKVAEVLARLFGADLEEIADTEDRRGPLGFMRSGREAVLARKVDIQEPTRDPADYDLVLIGTPVWMLSLSSPVRAYLELMRTKLPRVAFFATYGGATAHGRVFRQMEKVSGKAPLARLVLRELEVDRGGLANIERFIEQLAPGGPPRPPPGEHAALH